ncbi:MAG TPA: hypothetical protein VGE07_11150 [Herpetosiphonaceae bacterium]
MHEDFIKAIHDKRKVRIVFYSKEDGGELTRTAAPMDYGPAKRYADQGDRYHFWDYDSDEGAHPLLLEPASLRSLEALDETFDPAEFVTWEIDWAVPRDWGDLS